MRGLTRVVRELWIVLRSLWVNLVLFGLLLVAAAGAMRAFGCYPGATFHELVVNALYMARLESVPTSGPGCVIPFLVFIMPLLTLLVLGEGALRVAAIFLGRKQHRQEWERLMAGTLSGHIVLCGAGELGRTLLAELLRHDPNAEVVVVDIHPDVIEELGVSAPDLHHIHGDMMAVETLRAANVGSACTVLFVSGSDIHNLEAASKALRLNPEAQVWVRLGHIHLSEMLGANARPNLHFFSPYEQAAKALAGELAGRART
jgi:voltage-gated potassium channel Kch